ncbi:penicillin-binding protein [Pseudonocardia sp. S2-4]|uniref:Penicillin-binding protein n=1 Tax=Pseudonocardia humida TaxID=2800819 RepID=A0ABT0ZUR3_9PSEU|nr:penicillin-binding protein [Pseudonocardia humida]
MTRSRAPRRAAALLAVLCVLAGVGGCGLFSGEGPEEALTDFLAAWSAGDDAGAAALTDNPQAATEVLAAARSSLRPAGIVATAGQVREATERATASVDVRWDLGSGRTWSYLNELELVATPDAERGWAVRWAPTVVHPQLATGQRLAVRTEEPQQAPVVDRAGVPLLEPTAVVSVLLDRLAAGDLPSVTAALAAALSPLDSGITATSITEGAARTPDGQSYTVAVLRERDYLGVKNAIHDLPGLRFATGERMLAPDAGFARQVLPAVRTEMAEQLDGTPGWSVLVTDAAGTAIDTLAEGEPEPGATVGVSLDRAVQTAAEDAVEPVAQQAMIVAVAPSTGEVLAVAQNGPADVEGALALTGRYPPGSTFKIITADAGLAGAGLAPQTPVACPGSAVIGGRPLPNKGGFDLGTVPLRTAFAKSCNTTFGRLGADLPADALPAAALRFGIGADFVVPGVKTITGSVPPSDDPVQRAEDGIGQGEVLASPLGMALVAATVAHGSPVVPELVRGRPTEVTKPADQPDPARLDQVRDMMRAVVTEGTATQLAPLGEVYGKTGTAEFTGAGQAHGWFVGYRGDLAFAVLVVDGGSATVAVDTAVRFLSALG